MWPRHVRKAQARQVGEPQLEHARAQREAAAVVADVLELLERDQEPSRRCPRQPRLARHLAQRQRPVSRVEGADHRQPPLERLHEVGTASRGHAFGRRAAGRDANATGRRPPRRRTAERLRCLRVGAVAQLVVAPVSKTGGPRFESWLPRLFAAGARRPYAARRRGRGASTKDASSPTATSAWIRGRCSPKNRVAESSPRVRAPVLSKIDLTWSLTVCGEIPSRWAAWAAVAPRSTSWATSSSRAVS